MAKRTFASVTEQPCGCGYLQNASREPGSPIVFDATTHEFHFKYRSSTGGEGGLIIYHCPFCGGAAPDSRRVALFAVVPGAEEERLHQLLADVRTLEDAVRILGTPDYDYPQGAGLHTPEREGEPPKTEWFRSIIYTNLSEFADVHLTDYHKERVHVSLYGKHLGASPSEA